MSVGPVEFPTIEELKARRQELLREAGMNLEALVEGEYRRTLNMGQYIILDRIRGIGFLLKD